MRKLHFFGFLLLLVAAKTFGQTGQGFNLDRLPKLDTLLTGWIFQAGDNPQWAKPGFDDSRWQFSDPGIDIAKFKALKNAGVGWLRLHIKLDSALTGQQIAVWVAQYSASEIYLDGKLIQQYGQVSHDPAKTVALTPDRKPFELKLIAGRSQVIAVRLGYQSGVLYSSPEFTPLPAFAMYANTYRAEQANTNNALNLSQKLVVMNAIATGAFLIFCFIHLLYFIFDRSQKLNLYYLAYCFSIFLICINNIFIYYQGRTELVYTQMWVFFGGGICFCLAFLFLVLVVYELFDYPERKVFKILVVLSVATTLTYLYDDVFNGICVSIVFPVICMLEAARVCFFSIKQRKKSLGLLFFILMYIILYTLGGLLDQATLYANLLNYFVFLGLPVGMSVYLGIKAASTNRELKTTLAEVRMLSAQNLVHEQEKQQILATQNELLEQQVAERTGELSQSLADLKSTQTQLIQKEKMASLGELTAGIAHEIQNPLNFVNNFSEVNAELLQELKAEGTKPNAERDELLETGLINDLIENESKINQHGKRADAIVKGMLQHSKTSTGAKEPTNINALADEYMRLAYHGMQSKDKDFNAGMVPHFDPALQLVNVIPQDIGRVLLNLFNNAFYAVNQKQKAAGAEYKPEVTVSTSAEKNIVVIKVKDNGNGLPDAIKDKIMQPFFTTKPTGEGTGLGLSLSYDIVVKGHGGSIDIDTKEGEYAIFSVGLPG